MKKLFLVAVIAVLAISSYAQDAFVVGVSAGYINHIPTLGAEAGVRFNKNVVTFQLQRYENNKDKSLAELACKYGVDLDNLTPAQLERVQNRYETYKKNHGFVGYIASGIYERIIPIGKNISVRPVGTLGVYDTPSPKLDVHLVSSASGAFELTFLKHFGAQASTGVVFYQAPKANFSVNHAWTANAGIKYYLF